MVVIAVVAVWAAYTLLLRGDFANLMVSLFQYGFRMDSAAALALYDRIFRRHMDAYILLSLLLVFMALLSVFLRWLMGYFGEIGRGMDALLDGVPGEISLSPELLPIERKMNMVKHTLERQKSDMLLAEQKKNDLIMYLAHDLKTPLASSMGYLNLLRDEPQISQELREKYLSISLAKAKRLENLIDEFLEIAKYNLTNITLQYSEINLTRLLEQLVYEFRPVLEKKGLTCRLTAPEDMMLKCDADKLQRVFDNLLRNAWAYSYEGTQISIEVRESGDHVELRFSNHGGTIPAEKLERIFEQFYRLDPERGTEGSGLGLAIAKQIVTLHKGEITALSREGLTVFAVTLPIPCGSPAL
ncbi:sensor histidine kinase KdpD [uncultured Acetatifactor sp.]|uniref:sensor histidine kinase n=1 Tax=uncultured Acetatifactor sp. TaxID=1671927 RepID=UPI0026248DC5|nr:HAMP domain-containing sensor histidine kinase [uncultured Acetatifactor sp.]